MPQAAAGALAFLCGSAVLIAALHLVAPQEMAPLRAADAQMRAFAQGGAFPLFAAAQAEGRHALAMAAGVQTFAVFAALFGAAGFFAKAGFASARRRGWSDALWIAGVCLLFFLPALFPKLDVHLIDYALTSSTSFGERPSLRSLLLSPVFGPSGLNSRMSPSAFLMMRGAFAALLTVGAAYVFHDMGYRAREALAEFGLIDDEASQAQDAPRRAARDGAGAEQGEAEDERPRGFGQRSEAPPAPPLSEAAQARALLGVGAGASKRDIARAYRAKMKRAHPDHGGAVEQAAALNAARDLLLRG